jgi:thioredoxin 1
MRLLTMLAMVPAVLACAGCGDTPTAPSGAVVELNAGNFDQLIVGRSGAAMIEFFLPTCPHCQAMVSTVEQLAQNYSDRALVGRVDVSSQTGLSLTYQVTAVPTFVFFKHGREVSRLVGEDSYAHLAAALDAAIATP